MSNLTIIKCLQLHTLVIYICPFFGNLAGLLDYMVDMKKKEVTLRAIVDTKHINKKKRKPIQDTFDHTENKKNPCFSGFCKTMCLGAF